MKMKIGRVSRGLSARSLKRIMNSERHLCVSLAEPRQGTYGAALIYTRHLVPEEVVEQLSSSPFVACCQFYSAHRLLPTHNKLTWQRFFGAAASTFTLRAPYMDHVVYQVLRKEVKNKTPRSLKINPDSLRRLSLI